MSQLEDSNPTVASFTKGCGVGWVCYVTHSNGKGSGTVGSGPLPSKTKHQQSSDYYTIHVHWHRQFALRTVTLLQQQYLNNRATITLMGASQSSSPPPDSSHRNTESTNDADPSSSTPLYPTPTGHEYDALDKIAAELPNVIDDESRQQVEDYKQACDDGRGPLVACFATGEYLSLFERQHRAAAELYENVCFRPKNDKSPNGVLIDHTIAYPAGCFNLAKMLMTGKGGVPADRARAYQLFDRACRGKHGGACYLQAQILCTRPDALGGPHSGIPHDPVKAMALYQDNCDDGDSISCYTLAAMLLRGDKVNKTADNVSPQEARGLAPLVQREHEPDRTREPARDVPYVVPRNPARARDLLHQACTTGSHVTSCHNLAVMYTHGDDGVPADAEKAEYYKQKTQEKIDIFGGF